MTVWMVTHRRTPRRTGPPDGLQTPCAILPAMHVQLLKLALGLYSVGLLHSVLTVLRKKQTLFKPAVVATLIGFACHAASIAIRAYELQRFALAQRYESFSFFAALAVLAFLLVYWKYKIALAGHLFISRDFRHDVYRESWRTPLRIPFPNCCAADGSTSTRRWSFWVTSHSSSHSPPRCSICFRSVN